MYKDLSKADQIGLLLLFVTKLLTKQKKTDTIVTKILINQK